MATPEFRPGSHKSACGSLGVFGLSARDKEIKMKDLFKNRQFVALLAGLAFLLALVVFPDLPFSEDQTTVFFGLIAAYIVGEGLEGKRMLQNFGQLVKSRKFLATVAGLIVVVVQAYNPEFPVKADQLTELFLILGGIILGSGAEGIKLSKE
jgi:uncharacterized membrane protein HdeD (DUF308 family)